MWCTFWSDISKSNGEGNTGKEKGGGLQVG
jgi:hypothetical protein